MSTEQPGAPEPRIIHETAAQAEHRRRRFEAAKAAHTASPADTGRQLPLASRVALWAAGADAQLLIELPTERVRLVAAGMTVITTGAVTAAGSGFLLVTIGIPPVLAVPLGLLFALVNGLWDRLWFAAIWTGSIQRTVGGVISVLVRLLLALLSGAIVSVPLVLRIFAPEIELAAGPGAGLLEQLAALDRLGEQDPLFKGAQLALIALFFMIQILPMLVSAMTALGPPTLYSRVVRAQRHIEEKNALAAIEQQARQRIDRQGKTVQPQSDESSPPHR